MPLSDLDLAIQGQNQYNKLIPLKTVSEVNYSIVQNDDAIDVIFQGTYDIEDAKRDIEALMITTSFGRVHGGAYSGLPDVYETEKPNLPKDTPIRLTCHSLGAMEAVLFGCILYSEGYRNLEVVTFECPRVGDLAAMQYFNQIKNRTYQNYFNLFRNDFFTMIPLHLPEEPYAAIPNCKQFWSAPTANNEWKYAPENIQAHSLADCVIPGLRALGV